MQSEKLKELFIEELKDIFSAENQITKALPKMAKAAETPELKAAFEQHLEETQGHIERLQSIFDQLEESPKGKKCKGMEGLLAEGKEAMEEHEDEPEELEAALICAAQKVEHYEMATYGTLISWAKELEMDDVAGELEKTLQEEKATDKKLTQLAESSINVEAASE